MTPKSDKQLETEESLLGLINKMKEIDLIIEEDGVLHPVEIKKSSAPDKSAAKAFSVLKNASRTVGTGAVICMSDGSVGCISLILCLAALTTLTVLAPDCFWMAIIAERIPLV